jgi:coenzyme PQQ synthesis protein D (PqqD)
MRAGLSVNRSHVVYETIDGETILIHLGTGTYYSLDGVGAEAWELLATGATVERLLTCARDRYVGDPDEVELGLSGLVDELLREELLIEADGSASRLDSTGAGRLPSGRIPFAVPVLQAYTDMQEFMLVDPLHEVDEVAGWPHARAG